MKKFLSHFFAFGCGVIRFYLIMQAGCVDAAIVFPRQSEENRDIALREAIAFSREAPSLPTYFQTNHLSITMGYRCYWPDYHLGSSDKLLSIAVASSGWNYMLMCGTNMIGEVGLRLDSSNHFTFGGATFRGQPNPIGVGLEKAKKLPQVRSKDYEFRFLSLVGADYPTIWLHNDSDDILIPLSDGYRKWETYKPYSEREIIELMKPEFERVLKHPE